MFVGMALWPARASPASWVATCNQKRCEENKLSFQFKLNEAGAGKQASFSGHQI